MAINMGKSQPHLLKNRNLRRNLALDLVPVDAPENGTSNEFGTIAVKASSITDQGRQDISAQNCFFLHQSQMQADIQVRIFAGKRHGILNCTSGHKQRRARYNAVSKSTDDTSINGRCETKVIRVDNQLFQGARIVLLEFRFASSPETQ